MPITSWEIEAEQQERRPERLRHPPPSPQQRRAPRVAKPTNPIASEFIARSAEALGWSPEKFGALALRIESNTRWRKLSVRLQALAALRWYQGL